ncbi:hypothetical protein [Candidatus Nanohalococcus occultus]|uniref:Uncharacterized protein n=1 Tax=Candidatus Nanohalococcus occultus TaxID=2978047 RepID=A0ABY8CFR5_9ARCH|nr:hypothetical protein SVXNc_0288 [Candidatus Nanohaloarchaeota archaeon SVXNc]
MFGLGDSNKSKLEENMEEIKQMVDGETENSEAKEPEPDQDFQDSFSSEPSSSNSFSSESFDQPERNTGEPEDDSQGTEQMLQEEIEKFESENETSNEDQNRQQASGRTERPQERSRTRQQPINKHDGRGKSGGSGESSENRSMNADIPEPAKTRELDIPEVEKGPLFITRRKFETATRLIYEMRSLSQEIESTVQGMEQDIKRDRDMEQQVQTILNEFEQDRKDVESIISPK